MSNKTNMNTNSSTLKRSLKSTKSEDSTKIMAMVESSGLVMSNEDDVASAALVGLAEEKVLPDERIHDELKNIKQYIQELSLQQNLLLQTFVHQEQSQMTAESPSRMSSVALEQQREQLNQQLQSVSPSHFGEGVSSSSSFSPSQPIQSDSSSHLGDCSFTLNEEGVEVDCYDCGSVFFGCLRWAFLKREMLSKKNGRVLLVDAVVKVSDFCWRMILVEIFFFLADMEKLRGLLQQNVLGIVFFPRYPRCS